MKTVYLASLWWFLSGNWLFVDGDPVVCGNSSTARFGYICRFRSIHLTETTPLPKFVIVFCSSALKDFFSVKNDKQNLN